MGADVSHGFLLRIKVDKDEAAGLRSYLEGAMKRSPDLRRVSSAYRVRVDLDDGYLGVEVINPKYEDTVRQQYEAFCRAHGFRTEDIEEVHPEEKKDRKPERAPEQAKGSHRRTYAERAPHQEFDTYLVSRIIVGHYQGVSGVRRNFSNSLKKNVDTIDVVVREDGTSPERWTTLSFQELLPGAKGRKHRNKYFDIWPSETEGSDIVLGELAQAPRNFNVELVNDYRQPRTATLGHALTATMRRTIEREYSIHNRPAPLDEVFKEAMARNGHWKNEGVEVNPARVFVLPRSI